MKNRLLLVAIYLLFTTSLIYSVNKDNSVRIIGNNIEYASYHIEIKTKENLYLYKEKVLGSMYIDSTGKFDFILPLEKTTYAYMDIGRLRGEIYLEPGKEYQLLLPPFVKKEDYEMHNPFFQPDIMPLGILNRESQNLNRQMFEFDNYYENLFVENINEIAFHRNQNKVEEIIDSLESKFVDEHPFFVQHKNLSYLKLRTICNPKNEEELIKEYFLGSEWEMNLPIYTELFILLFKNYFPNKLNKDVQREIQNAFRTGATVDEFVEIIMRDTIFKDNRELAESLFLYSLYQGFYDQTMDENVVIYLSENGANGENSAFGKELAFAQYKQLTHMRQGYVAPSFSLFNQNGERKSLEDYKGKFIYLNFMSTINVASLRDMETLKNLQKVFRKDLEIITILLDESEEALEDFYQYNSDKKWDFLSFISYPQIIHEYNLVGVPSYFLISPDGILTLSPAPTPEENFRDVFVTQLQAYRRMQLRKGKGETKSIFGR